MADAQNKQDKASNLGLKLKPKRISAPERELTVVTVEELEVLLARPIEEKTLTKQERAELTRPEVLATAKPSLAEEKLSQDEAGSEPAAIELDFAELSVEPLTASGEEANPLAKTPLAEGSPAEIIRSNQAEDAPDLAEKKSTAKFSQQDTAELDKLNETDASSTDTDSPDYLAGLIIAGQKAGTWLKDQFSKLKTKLAQLKTPEPLKNFTSSLKSEFRPLSKAESPAEEAEQERIRQRRFSGAAGTVLLLVLLAAAIFKLVIAKLPANFLGMADLGLKQSSFMSVLELFLVILVPTLLVLAIYQKNPQDFFSQEKFSAKSLSLSCLAGILLSFFLTGLSNLSFFLLGKIPFFKALLNPVASLNLNSPLQALVSLIASIILPAICLELLFNGLIFNSLRNSGSTSTALVLTSLSFALATRAQYFVLVGFVLAYFLARLYLQAQDLRLSLLTRFTYLLSLFLIKPIFPIFTSKLAFSGQAGYKKLIFSLLVCIFSAIALLVLWPRLANSLPLPQSEKRPSRRSQNLNGDWKFYLALIILGLSTIFSRI